MKNRLIGVVFVILISLSLSSFAWEADFSVSELNPAVGETVTFDVCEPCLDGGDFAYAWDFDGDGVADAEGGTVSYLFTEAGFYRVNLTLIDEWGVVKTHTEGILVGATPAFAKRDVLVDSDGSLFVLITITILEETRAPGIKEVIPHGWTLEILDPSGGITNINAEERALEVLWMSKFAAGTELTISYRLHPTGGGDDPRFSGRLAGYTDTGRFEGEVCGGLSL